MRNQYLLDHAGDASNRGAPETEKPSVSGAVLSSHSMVDLESLAPERIRPIRRVEYDRMVEMGLFVDERVELLAGVLVEMSPQGTRHAEAVRRLSELFMVELKGRARISIQLPLALGDVSEPEPDLAVVPVGDYSRAHPSAALLVVEVADSSVTKDRRIKAPLYAALGVPEYWIVNLDGDVVEVLRDPAAVGFATVTTHPRGATLSPLAFPDLVVAVTDILPD
jgi:Uma2 family endonuclease